ncbi:MAG TPA: vanadium-dependent haloperoxidase [Thermoanaerobaculia bacterium]
MLSAIGAATAVANPVVYWNEVTMQAMTAGRPGPPGLLDAAIVHAAMHDAVQAIEGDYEPYFFSDPSAAGVGSADAAAVAAAYGTLVRLYPGQLSILYAKYAAYIAGHGLDGDPGLAVGEAAAAALHANHSRPAVPMTPFYGYEETGQWRSATPMAFLYATTVEPFTLLDNSQFRPAPPPPLNSGAYLRDYDEVTELGASTAHPSERTDIARFWSGNFPTQWNEALRGIADAQLLDVGEAARLFAIANLAASDAFLAVWECKRHYNLWRPSTAIREGDFDGDPKTIGNPQWNGFIPDPPYPDYVSGANGLTGAFTGILQLYFGGDELEFTVKNMNPLVVDKEREYTRISDAAQEVVDARVWLGIHFRFADTAGRELGSRVARWAFMRYLRPVPGAQ